jgi:hypothetical protein
VSAVLTSIDQVTPEWLTRVLRERGVLDRGMVVAVHPSDPRSVSGGGPGFRPSNRLQASYSADAPPSAPSRLYVKMYDGAFWKSAGQREVAFYASIAAAMPDPPAITCYDAAYDAETGAYHLLMDDVSETHRVVEREAPARKPDAERMVDALARFQAYWWGHGWLAEVESVDAWFIRGEEAVDFPGFADYMGDRLSAERRRTYERVLASLPGLLARRLAAKDPLTLVHDDAHTWNFVLPLDEDGGRVYLVDWQQWGVSAGPHDVAYLITLFWYRERRARMEQDLVRRYHGRLLAHGVTGYDWDACWRDYRLFAVRNLMVPLWAWTWARSQGRKDWGFHRWMQFEKSMQAFWDLGCAELLDG